MSIHSHKPTRIFCTVQTKFSMQLKHINHSKHKPLHSQNMQYPEFFCSVRLYQIIIIFMDSEHSVLPNLLRSLCRFFLWIFSTQISTLLRWSVSYLYLDAVLFSALLFVCFLPGWAYTSVVLSIDTLVLFLGIKASLDDSESKFPSSWMKDSLQRKTTKKTGPGRVFQRSLPSSQSARGA